MEKALREVGKEKQRYKTRLGQIRSEERKDYLAGKNTLSKLFLIAELMSAVEVIEKIEKIIENGSINDNH